MTNRRPAAMEPPPKGGMAICGLAIGPDDPVLSIWFASGRDQDWLAVIAVVDGRVRLRHRFRYYRDAMVFGSADEKSAYAIDGGPDTSANRVLALDAFGFIAHTAAGFYGFDVSRFMGGTAAEAMAWLQAQPFAHTASSGSVN